jgi:NAD(P)-dependent dehydrogenase (short-subunit alcohol dehydrogenase family)
MLQLNPKDYYPDEKNKIALVTGANRGLGYETCLQLAQLGLTVRATIWTARNTCQ